VQRALRWRGANVRQRELGFTIRQSWLWTITDELTGKRRQTSYRMTEEQARERFGDDAVKVEGSLEVRRIGST
jgi:hypothetical protein